MLEQANEPDVVAWLPHGRAFLVKNPQEFTDFVMPKYVVRSVMEINVFEGSLISHTFLFFGGFLVLH